MFRRSLPLLAVALFCTSAFSVVYLLREGRHSRELAASRDQMSAALAQARSQIDTLSAKVETLSAAPAVPFKAVEQRGSPAVAARQRPVVRAAAQKRQRLEDPRWKQMESQLSEQHKQIAKTQEDVQKASEELAGKLNSTRDELSGSIAKTHDELLSLQKRGERNYYEFQLTRSKQFQRVGPISLSLRKANTKHRYYDLAMIVEDASLDKKHVNLYEPVWVSLSDRPQAVELVVNKIAKDQIGGYISEPKYKKSELATTSATATPQTESLKQR